MKDEDKEISQLKATVKELMEKEAKLKETVEELKEKGNPAPVEEDEEENEAVQATPYTVLDIDGLANTVCKFRGSIVGRKFYRQCSPKRKRQRTRY